MNDVLAQLHTMGLIPVVAMEDAGQAAALAEALLAGGLGCAEITFRTPAAAKAIAAMRKYQPEMLVGAGTVLNVEQAKRALDAGARFIVSPGFSSDVVRYCADQGVAVTPGAVTATEIQQAIDHGLDVVKFFPAEAIGGLGLLKALSGPFGGIRFIPTGGIHADNLAVYLAHPAVLACGGSWIVKPAMIDGGEFDRITQLTREAVDKVREARGSVKV